MPDPTISEFLSQMNAAFVPEKAAGLDAMIQLKLTGAQPGEWYFVIKDQHCSLQGGRAAAAQLTVTVDGADLIKIFTGQLDGMQAFMTGKLKIQGDMNLAMKLLNLFKMA